jgi:hypothetical protein
MAKNWLYLGLAICLVALLLMLGYMFAQLNPVIVTQEVTRIVMVTVTPTPTPVIIEKIVTVVVTATPDTQTVDNPGIVAPTALESLLNQPTATPVPGPPTPPGETEQKPAVVIKDLDDPVSGLEALAQVAESLQAQDIHTLRLKMDMSVPIDLTVKNQQQVVDPSSTNRVNDELAEFNIHGNYIIDISVDELAQKKWMIEVLGATVGLNNEEQIELRHIGEEIWEKPNTQDWQYRKLIQEETHLPLGNSLVAIDAYSHALNLSELMVDALNPLLLVNPSVSNLPGDWQAITDPSIPAGQLALGREHAETADNNLKAVMSTLANSGLSTLIDPAAVTHGITKIRFIEKAQLDPATHFVNWGQVETKGQGATEVDYLFQRRLVDAIVIIRTDTTFEFLQASTKITAP